MAVRLSNYLDIDGAVGGHQIWWGEKSVGNHFGCGVIAALDSLIYSGHLGSRKMSQEAYMALATELWQVMHPNTGFRFRQPYDYFFRMKGTGIYSTGKLRRGLRRFARGQDKALTLTRLTNVPWRRESCQGDDAIDFIETCLEGDRPAHLLMWLEVEQGFSFHWVTIIGLDDQGGAEVATWGRKRYIEDFREFWKRNGLIDHKVLVDYQIS